MKNRITIYKQIRYSLAVLLSSVMLFYLIPVSVFAEPAVLEELEDVIEAESENENKDVSPLNGYGVSNPRITVDSSMSSGKLVTYDCVYFGKCIQEDANYDRRIFDNEEALPIKWRVLSVSGNDALIISDHPLDYCSFQKEYTDYCWDRSYLRSYLNGYGSEENGDNISFSGYGFIDYYFTEQEQSAMIPTYIAKGALATEKQKASDQTVCDKLFVPSIDDMTNADYGFSTADMMDEARKPVNTTQMARRSYFKGAIVESDTINQLYKSSYFLRSRTSNSGPVYVVAYDGIIIGDSVNAYSDNIPIRPALHLDLSSDVWKVAGTVDSKGNVKGLSYNVSFDANGGTVTETTRVVSHGDKIGALPTPERSDYIFAGWYPENCPDITICPDDTIIHDVKLMARWKSPNVYGINNPRIVSDETMISGQVVTYDNLYFGNYWVEDTNGDGKVTEADEKRPIKWRVLSVDGNEAFLLSEYSLFSTNMNQTGRGATWKGSLLDNKLNNAFLENAFSQTEQQSILTKVLLDYGNPFISSVMRNSVTEKISLLSEMEARNCEYGFSSNPSIADEAKAYKPVNAADSLSNYMFLRTVGFGDDVNIVVDRQGKMNLVGRKSDLYQAVRPVIRIDLSNENWKKAGSVDTKGNVYSVVHTHSIGTHHEAVLGTCVTSGTIEYWECQGCNLFLNEQCEIINDITDPINPGNHAWNEGEVTCYPTVTSPGEKTYTCKNENCGAQKTETLYWNAQEDETESAEVTLKTKTGETSANITIKPNGADQTTFFSKDKKEKKLVFVKKLTRKGYTFKGWFNGSRKVTTVTEKSLKDGMVIEAKFIPNVYSINYKVTKPAKKVKVIGKIKLDKNEKKIPYCYETVNTKGTELSADGYTLEGFTTIKNGTTATIGVSETVSIDDIIPNKGKSIVLYTVWKQQ